MLEWKTGFNYTTPGDNERTVGGILRGKLVSHIRR